LNEWIFLSNDKNRVSWNLLSDYYQKTTLISLEDVHYGPYSPGEKTLMVIGDVKGLDVLELGCGGGQNAIVLAKWGAKTVKALDQSSNQLEYARNIAITQNVEIEFLEGSMEDLSMVNDNSVDLIVSSHALSYVENLENVLTESYRVLRKPGRIVICILHPMMPVVWEAMEEGSFKKIRSYFSDERDIWDWEDKDGQKIASFGSTYFRFEQIINGLITAGFQIDRIVEPLGYTLEEVKKLGEAVPYQNGEEIDTKFISINQQIPFSLIVSAVKNA
jgi:ubiquinone/menaquinone biosynthesis C-methylase UbiE